MDGAVLRLRSSYGTNALHGHDRFRTRTGGHPGADQGLDLGHWTW